MYKPYSHDLCHMWFCTRHNSAESVPTSAVVCIKEAFGTSGDGSHQIPRLYRTFIQLEEWQGRPGPVGLFALGLSPSTHGQLKQRQNA